MLSSHNVDLSGAAKTVAVHKGQFAGWNGSRRVVLLSAQVHMGIEGEKASDKYSVG